MTVQSEPARLQKWLVTRFNSDATLQGLIGGTNYTHPEIVPDGAPMPAILLKKAGWGPDTASIGSRNRIWTKPVLNIYAVNENVTQESLQTIADRLETLLQDVSGVQGTLNIYQVERVTPWQRTYENLSNQTRAIVQELGGTWRFWIN